MGVHTVRINDWLITFHKIPYTPWTIGYFPKGPMPTRRMLEILETLGREKNAIFIQLEPSATGTFDLLPRSYHPLFTKYTFILDLTKSEDELLAAMHAKTRYNIRLAQKHGVIVKEDNSPKAFEAYLHLTRETTQRQGFFAHNLSYHKTMWQVMHKVGIAHLWTATYKEKIITAWIIFVLNQTVYYPYGASSREYREVMAPNLLLWDIAKWAKAKGYKKFDLWGAMGPNPNTKDPWYGFHRFKEGYGPNLIEFAGSYDLVLNPFLYQLYKIADTVRWIILKK